MKCEMRAATVLRRSGWSPEMFVRGASIKVTGRGIGAEDPVYFADKYVDSDSVLPADAPFRVEACKELAPECQQTGGK